MLGEKVCTGLDHGLRVARVSAEKVLCDAMKLAGDTAGLPPFIIDQLRWRERGKQQRGQIQPTVEIPTPYPTQFPTGRSEDAESSDDEEENRGVLIIDLG